MSVLESFLPPDRLEALAHNQALPDRADGAVLFADISGFTALTEAMTHALGVRRGAEELTRQLNTVYDVLIAEISKYGGSVINFAGDAALCWFANENTASGSLRAVTCAFVLQRAMQQFSAVSMPNGGHITLTIKVTVTGGSVRRFVVGDPNIRFIDAIAGNTVTRSATAEHLAHSGEILIDKTTATALDAQIEIQEWRAAPDTLENFAVLRALHHPAAPREIPPPLSCKPEQIKSWLHATVFERLQNENETFLSELRPVVAMFVRFQGIDFDGDADAGSKLDQFITRAQQILARYGGTLLELTIGDKGSYFYATFGALHIHEDDARRAVFAGRELFPLCRELGFLEPLQVGISQGTMRVGTYGGITRRMYGAQGDEVNLAARLMTEAASGMLLVSGRIQKTIANEFDLEPLPPIRLKGKAEPLLPFVVQGLRGTRVQQLQEAYYSLPMIGRDPELELIQRKLLDARHGTGQIIGITARAGMGKSRLTAEVIRLVRRQHESSYSGECQSFGTNFSYLVWVPIWRAFFGIDSNMALRRQLRVLETALQELAPERVDALPCLSTVLDLPIPDNGFTRGLEPELRKSVLHALLRDCLASAAQDARSQGQVLLFVIEDLHWIDPASRELLQELAAGIAALPVVFLLNYRPPENEAEQLREIARLPNFTQINLATLTPEQGEGLIRAKLAQHAPESSTAIPAELIARVNAQAQGNPFYIEQLLDYMHDRGLNFHDPAVLRQLELPNTLHRLILSRIDRLNEQQQLTLKAASIIGRTFSLAHLCGYFPDVGSTDRVRDDLMRLTQYDLTSVDNGAPEIAYLFKHIVTHQVAYESLAFATRALLHEAYARFIETQGEPERALDLIAYHYDRSTNLVKRKEYLQRAGQAAAARFANAEALSYLTRALELTTPEENDTRFALLDTREKVYDVQGEREQQRADLVELEKIAMQSGDVSRHLHVQIQQAWFAERIADHAAARQILEHIQSALNEILNKETRLWLETEVELLQGIMLWQQGNATAAKPRMEHALRLARTTHDSALQIRALSFLGLVLRELGENTLAQTHYTELLEHARASGNKRSEWSALNNLGLIANTRGDFSTAFEHYNQALEIVRDIGDRPGESVILSNRAITSTDQGEFNSALQDNVQAQTIADSINDRRAVCRIELNLGELYRLSGDYAAAKNFTERAFAEARALADQFHQNFALMNLAAIALEENHPERARELVSEALLLARGIQHREGEAFLLNALGRAELALGQIQDARITFRQALALWNALEPSPYSLQANAGLAEIALQQNELETARQQSDSILAFLEQHPNRAGDPAALAAMLTCYHVLRALNDDAAVTVLERAYQELQTRADKISDGELKRSFLENVSANAKIVQEWNAREQVTNTDKAK